MEEFETKSREGQGNGARSDPELARDASSFKELVRRIILFICCGPGVLGFLWFIGRILRR
jgi:hypothetical protein